MLVSVLPFEVAKGIIPEEFASSSLEEFCGKLAMTGDCHALPGGGVVYDGVESVLWVTKNGVAVLAEKPVQGVGLTRVPKEWRMALAELRVGQVFKHK